MSDSANVREIPSKPNTGAPDDVAQTLCNIAWMSNNLAKKSRGRDRVQAYKIKVRALNTLVANGWAHANGVDSSGTVGLDIDGDTVVRLHIPFSLLSRRARVRVLEQIRSPHTVQRDEWQ